MAKERLGEGKFQAGPAVSGPEPHWRPSAVHAGDGGLTASFGLRLLCDPEAPSSVSGLGFGKSKHKTKVAGVGFRVKGF